MTSLDRLRAAALALPEAKETLDDGVTAFDVAGKVFATMSGDALHVLADDEDERFATINLAGDPDWALIEDRVARGWELAAPRRLLEAGGR